MAGSLGEAVLDLVTNTDPLEKGLDAAKGKTNAFGKIAIGVMGGVAIGAIGVGVALLKIGSDFDEATDLIAIKTGATGDELDGLTADMKAVFSSVPVDAKTAAEAIATVNQRLDLSGPAAQTAAIQYLNMARVLGTEVGPLIESTSKVWAAWNVETEDQAAALDMVFAAGQKTGVTVEALTSGLEKFGPALRGLGFDITESTAMLAGWEKQGLNGEGMMTGLALASKKFALEGIPVREGLQDTIDKIGALGPGADATKLAIEVFGKQGITMADAIHKGAFEIDNLTGQLKLSEGQINKTATGTDDWTQKLDLMKNKLLVAVAPAADAVFNGLGALIEWVTPYIEQLAVWIGENLPGAMKNAGEFLQRLKPLFDALGVVLGFIGEYGLPLVGAALGILGQTFDNIGNAVSTFIGWLRQAWDWINNVKNAAANLPGVQGIGNFLGGIMGHAAGTDHITNGPELFVAGEGGVREHVRVGPAGSDFGGGPIVTQVFLDGRQIATAMGARNMRGAGLAGAPLG